MRLFPQQRELIVFDVGGLLVSILKYKVLVTHHGDIERYEDGKLHRVNGPAIEYLDGTKYWWLNDDMHRADGPAIIYPSGSVEYVFEGIFLSKRRYLEKIKLAMSSKGYSRMKRFGRLK